MTLPLSARSVIQNLPVLCVSANLIFLHQLPDSAALLADDVAVQVVRHFHIFRYGHQRLQNLETELVWSVSSSQDYQTVLTSSAALASSHLSARPEIVMMSHLRGTNSASGLTSPFSCGKLS